jgi:hypothetical protein
MPVVATIAPTTVSMAVSPVAAYVLGVAPTVYSMTSPEPPDGFNIFCYVDSDADLGGILADPAVDVTNAPAFSIDAVTNDLVVSSGGSAPNTDDALLLVGASVPATWTLQVVARVDALPVDFSDLIHQHFYIGAVDQVGAAAGLFVSSVGAAYAPRISLNGDGDLVLDGPFQPIPGTSGLFHDGVSYTFRIAADTVTGTVYIFATETDQVQVIGHRLIAVMPNGVGDASAPEGAMLSVRGTALRGVSVAVAQLCLGAGLVMPNVPPKADAGRDQAIRACTVGILDGSASFDPDGGSLTYNWRVVDVPLTSAFAVEGNDGFTAVMSPATGFSDKFYSAALGSAATVDAVVTGDVLVVQGKAWTVASTGVDGLGYFVQFAAAVVADNLVNAPFKLVRNRLLSDADTVSPTFLPDVAGIYRFELRVFDGQYLSESSAMVVNVLANQVPRGCIPDLGFVWGYLSDFWNLVEGRERIQVFWEGLAQVTASELLNLWQTDYSKSLRDVQRQFQRRWLHYDLKLPEPLPELTTLRQVRGGVRSTAISSSGVFGVQGTKVVVTSPVHAPVVIDFALANPYFAEEIRRFLAVKLLGVDARYAVTLLTDALGVLSVRITAPFYFEMAEGTTLPFFSVGQSNRSPRGVLGVRLTPRVFRVEFSLVGLDIQENDVLVIGEDGYLVSRVVDDPTDGERFQRIVVQSDLPVITSDQWYVSGHVSSKLLNFYDGQVSQDDVVVLELHNLTDGSIDLVRTSAIGACAEMVTRLAIDLDVLDAALSDPAYALYLAFVTRRTRLPVGELVVGVPFLQQNIQEKDDSVVLRENVDFKLVKSRGANSLRFMSGRVGDAGDVWDGQLPPARLWAETTFLDNRPTIEANFGIPAELTVEQLTDIGTDTDYLSAVRGLWYTLINGPTMFNLRAGTQILLGLPFAEEAGTIIELRTDYSQAQGRILVQDKANTAIVRSYTFPKILKLEKSPVTGVPYTVGDEVEQFAPMVEGTEVLDYLKDPAWFQGILNQGSFFEVEKFHKFIVRVDSAAFNLSALLFVQSFIRRVKPTYTKPLFIVRYKIGDTEVSVSDEVRFHGRLILNDGACFPNFNLSQSFDDYRAAGGGVRNQFDRAADPAIPAPTFPTPTGPITWGFDKKYLCPEDEVAISYCVSHAGGVVTFDEGFAFDASNAPSHHFSEANVTSVAAGPTGHALPGTSTVAVASNVVELRVVISGTLGASPGNYELVVHKNSTDVATIPITVASSGFLGTLVASIAVAVSDVLSVRIRPASGGARTPNWSYIAVTLGQTPIMFQFDAGVPAGTYCFNHIV